jgi:hypothetical protein
MDDLTLPVELVASKKATIEEIGLIYVLCCWSSLSEEDRKFWYEQPEVIQTFESLKEKKLLEVIERDGFLEFNVSI